MPKYMTRPPKNEDEEFWVPEQQSITVIEDNDPQAAGLLDVHGNLIFRCAVTVPVGYRAK